MLLPVLLVFFTDVSSAPQGLISALPGLIPMVLSLLHLVLFSIPMVLSLLISAPQGFSSSTGKLQLILTQR